MGTRSQGIQKSAGLGGVRKRKLGSGVREKTKKNPHEGIIQFTKPYAGPFTSFVTGKPKFLGNSRELF